MMPWVKYKDQGLKQNFPLVSLVAHDCQKYHHWISHECASMRKVGYQQNIGHQVKLNGYVFKNEYISNAAWDIFIQNKAPPVVAG